MDFAFYNINSICGFTSMLTVVCAKTSMLCILPTVSKRAQVCIIHFILTTLNNEQHPFKRIRVGENGAFKNSTDVTNLLIEEFKISMESTGGDASCINRKN